MMFADPAVPTPGQTGVAARGATRQRHRGHAAAAVRARPEQLGRGRSCACGPRQPQRVPPRAGHRRRGAPCGTGFTAARVMPRVRRCARWPRPPTTPACRPRARPLHPGAAAAAGATELVLQAGDVAQLAALLPAGTVAANWRLLQIGAVAVADFIFATRAAVESATTRACGWRVRCRPTWPQAAPWWWYSPRAAASTLAQPAQRGRRADLPLVSPLPAPSQPTPTW